jgi:hypothetical protein
VKDARIWLRVLDKGEKDYVCRDHGDLSILLVATQRTADGTETLVEPLDTNLTERMTAVDDQWQMVGVVKVIEADRTVWNLHLSV